jgi:hypothetical protein
MHFKSQKASLLILAITAIAFSRILFVFFNDPEGPNLLVVMGAAVIVYFLSLGAYWLGSSTTSLNRLLLAIFVQIIIVMGLYFGLN